MMIIMSSDDEKGDIIFHSELIKNAINHLEDTDDMFLICAHENTIKNEEPDVVWMCQDKGLHDYDQNNKTPSHHAAITRKINRTAP